MKKKLVSLVNQKNKVETQLAGIRQKRDLNIAKNLRIGSPVRAPQVSAQMAGMDGYVSAPSYAGVGDLSTTFASVKGFLSKPPVLISLGLLVGFLAYRKFARKTTAPA
jgi:hypothetical protein